MSMDSAGIGWSSLGVPGGGPPAPSNAQFLTLATSASLSNERVFTPGQGLAGTDAGAGSTYTLANTLITGLAGGQTVKGGTLASQALTLTSTNHATKGLINIGAAGTSFFDEATGALTISGLTTVGSLTVGTLTGILKGTTGVVSVATPGTDYEVALTFGNGLTRTVNAVANNLITGLAGGQTIIGGTAASETLTLRSTSNATKGQIILGTTSGVVFDGVTNSLGIGAAAGATNMFLVTPAALSLVASAGTAWNSSSLAAGTLTLTGSTGVTQINFAHIAAPTITDVSAVTVTDAYTSYVAGPPVAAGSVTITRAWAAGFGGNVDISNNSSSRSIIFNKTTAGSSDHVLDFQQNRSSVAQIDVNCSSTTGQIILFTKGAGALTEAARLTTTQNLLIGTTTDVASTRLRVNTTSTVVSATGAVWDGIELMASTLTLTGTTTVTQLNAMKIAAPVVTDASVVTVTDTYSLFIEPPTQAGSATLTNKWSLGAAGAKITGTSLIANSTLTGNFIVCGTSGGGELQTGNIRRGSSGATNAMNIVGNSTNTSAGIGVRIANTTALVTAGAKICQFFPDDQVTEKAYVDKDGGYITTTGVINGLTIQAAGRQSLSSDGANIYVGPSANIALTFVTNNTSKGGIDNLGNWVVGTAALNTTATDGFLYVPTCAGTPSGVPTTKTGMIPIIIDSTNDKLYFYRGGWKGGTVPGAFI